MPSRSLSNSQACSNDIQAARRTSVSCPRGVTPAPSSPNCSSRGENSLPTLWAGPVAAFQLDRLSSVGLQEARLLPARHQHRCTSLTSGTALCWPCAPLSRLAHLHQLLDQLRSQLVYLRIYHFLSLLSPSVQKFSAHPALVLALTGVVDLHPHTGGSFTYAHLAFSFPVF